MAAILTLALAAGGAGKARAQMHNDYTSTNSQFSTTGPSLKFINATGDSAANSTNISSQWHGRMPDINQSMTGRNLTMGQVPSTFSSLNGKNAPSNWQSVFQKSDNLGLKMAPTPNTRQPLMSSGLQKNSSLNDYTAYDRWRRPGGPSKYNDAFVFHATSTSQQIAQLDEVGRELSMQDINRYQFHSSNSSEPGLPTIHAAGDMSQPTINSTPLTSTPSLFDFGGKNVATTTQVHSGSSVAPHVITSDGPRPYLPTLGRGAAPTQLIGTPPNAPPPPKSINVSSQSNSTPSQGISQSLQPTSGPAPNLTPKGHYPQPRDGVNTPVELGPKQVWVDVEE